jgi:predicted Ser/Thr protein kinase
MTIKKYFKDFYKKGTFQKLNQEELIAKYCKNNISSIQEDALCPDHIVQNDSIEILSSTKTNRFKRAITDIVNKHFLSLENNKENKLVLVLVSHSGGVQAFTEMFNIDMSHYKNKH